MTLTERPGVPARRRGGAAPDRIGVVDVGSNSVRLVVFEGGCRSPAVVFNEKALCGLGARLAETGRLDPEGVARARRALARFAALAPQLGVGRLAGVATAAVREAADGAAFRERIARETGIELSVASGAEEARLAAQGVLFGNPRADGVVADLGGASLELSRIGGGRPGPGRTTPLGPQRLTGSRTEVRKHIRKVLGGLPGEYRLDGRHLYLVGGAWRALARAEMARVDYPLKVLHEYTLEAEAAMALGNWAARSRPEGLAELPGVSANRVQAMPLTGRLLAELVDILEPGQVSVSAFGLREGVCLDQIPAALREEDPLIAACRAQEARRARCPGFGAELGPWVARLLAPEDPEESRLLHAAALLADVNWRTHPDYRAQGCWETVTRTSITDLGHRGRVFLAAALVARHSRKGADGPAMALLDAGTSERALIAGQAMRLGAVIAGSAPGILARARIAAAGGRLTLRLTGRAGALSGEEVDKRLGLLARAMGLAPHLETA